MLIWSNITEHVHGIVFSRHIRYLMVMWNGYRATILFLSSRIHRVNERWFLNSADENTLNVQEGEERIIWKEWQTNRLLFQSGFRAE